MSKRSTLQIAKYKKCARALYEKLNHDAINGDVDLLTVKKLDDLLENISSRGPLGIEIGPADFSKQRSIWCRAAVRETLRRIRSSEIGGRKSMLKAQEDITFALRNMGKIGAEETISSAGSLVVNGGYEIGIFNTEKNDRLLVMLVKRPPNHKMLTEESVEKETAMMRHEVESAFKKGFLLLGLNGANGNHGPS